MNLDYVFDAMHNIVELDGPRDDYDRTRGSS